MRNILLKNGFIISMDPSIGELSGADVLIVDGRIAQVGKNISAEGAEVIDVSGKIVMPGMVDTHRHTWQTQLRAICADMSLEQYMRCIRFSISPVYTPEDVYVGNYIGALEAINAGVTTLYDFSHTSHSPEHADEAIRGLRDAGIRGIYGYGYYSAPVDNPWFATVDQRIADAERVRKHHFSSSSDLLQMGVAITEAGMYPFEIMRREILSGRHMAVPQTIHTNCFWGSAFCSGVERLAAEGLLGPDQIHVHCNTSTDLEMRLLSDNGCRISCTPDTEMQMGMGHPVIGKAVRHNIKPTLGADVISCNGGDLLTQARLGLQDARVLANDALNHLDRMPEDIPFKVRDAIAWMTINGAEAMGLASTIGTLSVGKSADIVVVAPNDFNLAPLNDMMGAVVLQSNVSNIETVLINGKVVKRDGKLVGINFAEAYRIAAQSRDRIMEAAQRRGPLLPPPDQTAMAHMNEMAAANVRK
ncbi:amidohydrolase family protein [Achromobacter xylosoxidans]